MNNTQLMNLADVRGALEGAANARKLARTLWVQGRMTVDAMNYVRGYL